MQCNVCNVRYVGGTIEKCRTPLNLYKCVYNKFRKRLLENYSVSLQQGQFDRNLCNNGYTGINEVCSGNIN